MSYPHSHGQGVRESSVIVLTDDEDDEVEIISNPTGQPQHRNNPTPRGDSRPLNRAPVASSSRPTQSQPTHPWPGAHVPKHPKHTPAPNHPALFGPGKRTRVSSTSSQPPKKQRLGSEKRPISIHDAQDSAGITIVGHQKAKPEIIEIPDDDEQQPPPQKNPRPFVKTQRAQQGSSTLQGKPVHQSARPSVTIASTSNITPVHSASTTPADELNIPYFPKPSAQSGSSKAGALSLPTPPSSAPRQDRHWTEEWDTPYPKREIQSASPSPEPVKPLAKSVSTSTERSLLLRNSADEEDEDGAVYDLMHAGYDLHGSSWVPLLLKNKESLEDSHHDLPLDPPASYPASRPDVSSRTSLRHSPPFQLIDPPQKPRRVAAARQKFSRPGARTTLPLHRLHMPRLASGDFEAFFHLSPTHQFKSSSGAISRIEQKGRWTVIASSATEGGLDLPLRHNVPGLAPVLRYNNPGGLIVWHDGLCRIPRGHQLTDVQSRHDGLQTKHYGVNDVRFSPNLDNVFVSTGDDLMLRFWEKLDYVENDLDPILADAYDDNVVEEMAWVSRYHYKFGSLCAPIDIATHGSTSMFAVGAEHVQLFNFRSMASWNGPVLRLWDEELDVKFHRAGSIQWGTGPTADYLVASSEPRKIDDPTAEYDDVENPERFKGYHRIFDVNEDRSEGMALDAKGAGEALATDPFGDRLILVHTTELMRHTLALYDFRNRDTRARVSFFLEPLADGCEEHNAGASFSPDGIYIALPRSDNRVHVYDSRMLSAKRRAGVLYDFRHTGESKVATDGFGVVRGVWASMTTGGRYSYVTGGEDGCIRLWDPLQAADNVENGRVIASINSDVGYFVLGDPQAGEKRLVVGGSDGEVVMFDRLAI